MGEVVSGIVKTNIDMSYKEKDGLESQGHPGPDAACHYQRRYNI